MNMDPQTALIVETTATMIGIFTGTILAFAVDKYNERQKKKKRAKILLRSISKELRENFDAIQSARQEYMDTPWGKSFYISSSAWDTAVAGGDLPDIIGFELADCISAQYALFVRIRYYVDLMTQLWLVPETIPGYAEKRAGFHNAILESMNKVSENHRNVISLVDQNL
ncbi:MAG: hypothetical protein LWY06_01980 [Firmicutes bacterium]|nr:hypothetical protein [Bacillota bacterium]